MSDRGTVAELRSGVSARRAYGCREPLRLRVHLRAKLRLSCSSPVYAAGFPGVTCGIVQILDNAATSPNLLMLDRHAVRKNQRLMCRRTEHF